MEMTRKTNANLFKTSNSKESFVQIHSFFLLYSMVKMNSEDGNWNDCHIREKPRRIRQGFCQILKIRFRLGFNVTDTAGDTSGNNISGIDFDGIDGMSSFHVPQHTEANTDILFFRES